MLLHVLGFRSGHKGENGSTLEQVRQVLEVLLPCRRGGRGASCHYCGRSTVAEHAAQVFLVLDDEDMKLRARWNFHLERRTLAQRRLHCGVSLDAV